MISPAMLLGGRSMLNSRSEQEENDPDWWKVREMKKAIEMS